MKKICFVCPDDLSALIFAKSFGAVLKDYPGVSFHTIAKLTIFKNELSQIGSHHIPIEMERFIDIRADIKFFFHLLKIMREQKYDLVVTFTTKPNIYAAPAAWFAGVPKIAVAVRGMGRIFEPSNNLKDKALRLIVSAMYRFAFKVSNLVWFTNPADRNFCEKRGLVNADKTVLTRNAVDIQDFSMEAVPDKKLDVLRNELGICKNDKVVIMVGRMIWSKGIREYAEAAEILRSRLPHLKFILVAPIEKNGLNAVPPSYIEKMAQKTNLIWLEFRKDIRDVYALADLAVLPSYYKEGGYPRALLEPMALSKPVIGADTPDCRSPIDQGRNGYLVPVRDSRKLAQRIEEIITNPEIAEQFGKFSRELVERKYDDRFVAREILSHLQLTEQ